MRGKLLSLAPLVLATALAQVDVSVTREGPYWVRRTEASVSAAGVDVLRLITSGNVVVEGTDTARISYSIVSRVRAPGRDEAARQLSRVFGSGKRRGSALNLEFLPAAAEAVVREIRIRVPRQLSKSDIETYIGDIEARGLSGKLIARSGGGLIHADEIGNAVDAETAGGEIVIGSADGPVRCLSAAGSIRVGHAGGAVDLETAGGEVRVEDARDQVQARTAGGNVYVGNARGKVFAYSGGGLIEVRNAQGLVVAENGGGPIHVGAARHVKCESAGGTIRLKQISGMLHASTGSGNILAVLTGENGLTDSFLDTSYGDITVLIPSNLAVTVKAQNIPAGRTGRIVSDFPELTVRSHGAIGFTPSLAFGALNGGGPTLKISATGGSIFLRRR